MSLTDETLPRQDLALPGGVWDGRSDGNGSGLEISSNFTNRRRILVKWLTGRTEIVNMSRNVVKVAYNTSFGAAPVHVLTCSTGTMSKLIQFRDDITLKSRVAFLQCLLPYTGCQDPRSTCSRCRIVGLLGRPGAGWIPGHGTKNRDRGS